MGIAFMYGGLGNQLFKFFSALNLALKFETNLNLNTSWYSSENRQNLSTVRKFELLDFPEIARFCSGNTLPFKMNSRFFRTVSTLPIGVKLKLGIVDDSNISASTAFNLSIGSFERYELLPSDDVVNSKLHLNPTHKKEFSTFFNYLEREKPIALHVRLGDKSILPSIYNKLSINYYSEALRLTYIKQGERPIWLFSDAPIEAQRMFHGKVDFSFVVPTTIPPSVTLLLMSRAKGIVNSNSTFSWWASYISTLQDLNSTVIQPDQYDQSGNLNFPLLVRDRNWLIVKDSSI